MRTMSFGAAVTQVRPIVAAIQSLGIAPVSSPGLPTETETAVKPFVTISRQAGAGGVTLANRLVEHLNQVDAEESPWTAWDRELAQRVAEEHHISQTLVETLGDRGQPWLLDMLDGFSTTDAPESASEMRVFWKTAATIRAIAQVGRCIIVGRGGAFITRGMRGGVHIRLVAPLDFRIKNFAQVFDLPLDQAEKRVHELDRNRMAFYKRYWPSRPITPESFAATYNTAEIGERQLVNSVVALIKGI